MSTDVTFQTEGGMVALVKNETNWGESGVVFGTGRGGNTDRWLIAEDTALTYLPEDKPPKAWVGDGQDYLAPTPALVSRLVVNRSPLILVPGDFPTSVYRGPQWLVAVNDRSKARVEEDKSYIFTTAIVGAVSLGVQLRFTITGVPGGSVVEPAVGLFNTKQNPGAWYYHRPAGGFPGDWSFRLQNPYFDTYLSIQVEYVPAAPGPLRTLFSEEATPYSRLVFTLAGEFGQFGYQNAEDLPPGTELVQKFGQRIV